MSSKRIFPPGPAPGKGRIGPNKQPRSPVQSISGHGKPGGRAPELHQRHDNDNSVRNIKK
jgi:hypothetical protein